MRQTTRHAHWSNSLPSFYLSSWSLFLFYRFKNGNRFISVSQNDESLIYYLFRREDENISLVAYFKGFNMITEDQDYRSDQESLESRAIFWACIDYSQTNIATRYILNRNYLNNLRMQIVFPNCWDEKKSRFDWSQVSWFSSLNSVRNEVDYSDLFVVSG